MNCREFEILGDVIPPALRADTRGGRSTVTARLGWAEAIARQLRRRDQLLLKERHAGLGQGTGYLMEIVDAKVETDGIANVEPRGDQILAANRDEVLTLLARHLHDFTTLHKRITDSWSDLRDIYGYDAPEWTERPTGSMPHHRVTVRIAICLAADATFAPFSRGLLDATAIQQASLRIDLRSAAEAIWAWAQADYPALSRSLMIARSEIDGSSMGFPAFEELFRRVLSNHLGTGIDDPDQANEIKAIANTLDRLTITALADAPIPGQTAAAVSASLVKLVAQEQPDWIGDAAEEDPGEVFAAGAAPLVLDVLLGRRQPASVAHTLDALRRAMETASGGQVGA